MKNTGITLILLVITIAVLIILASVVITMSLSNTGLFNRAKQAKIDYQTATNEEIYSASKLKNDIDEKSLESTRTINNNTSTEKVLYEGNCSECIKNAVISDTSPMITLNESIENFKSIRIEFLSAIISSSKDRVSTETTRSVSLIKQHYGYALIEAYAGLTGYSSRQSYGFFDSTHMALCWENYTGWPHNSSYIIVTGIK